MLRSLTYMGLWQNPEELQEYDVLIQSGNEPLWYTPRDEQVTIAYTHSPPRWQYDLYHQHGDTLGDKAAKAYNMLSRVLYDHTTRFPDLFVANSELIARRIRRYWRVPRDEIQVVYPPIQTAGYGSEYAEKRGDYYLMLSRLCAEKRVDEIIEAFQELEARLVIAGKGPERDALEEQAADASNIEFAGYVSESEKRRLMAEAKAFVYNPLNEDFGIVPIESMASGTPVLGVCDGYTKYQIDHGRTGLLYDRGPENLRDAVEEFERDGVSATRAEIEAEAEHYSVEEFRAGMRAAVEEAEKRARIVPKRRLERFEEISDAEPALTDGGEHE